MKFLVPAILASLATTALASLCTPIPAEDGVTFDIIHYVPPEFTSGQEFYVFFYGQVWRTIDRDVVFRTYFYDSGHNLLHSDEANWCAILEAHKGTCPMKREDGFKIGVPHKFTADVDGEITVETEVVDGQNACLAVSTGTMRVVQ
ncbi:hypothetical protein DFQ26_000112 [Actinomortierella ambigua]|nr:hypothetical protein DFQ26_000112 [Actinomortierella ambigua]